MVAFEDSSTQQVMGNGGLMSNSSADPIQAGEQIAITPLNFGDKTNVQAFVLSSLKSTSAYDGAIRQWP
ncbi:hypothetical protein O181_001846 [Austropuccinia psidii MF-1]|uniref:Uncharacterized protein n=1 Tax=Austropuccinia psidii MF-1 TaxID=1389203 RepID=A0A9Q3GCT1_9BASI|nr:hypothetical protein [Austropuccinia psidii MF-1]